MSYVTYKVIHYLGAFLLIATLGAALGRRAGSRSPDARNPDAEGLEPQGSRTPGERRRWWAALHGVALFIVLLGGFGLMARLGVGHGGGFPGWIWMKLTIWGVLGSLLLLARKRPGWSLPLFALVPLLAALAGYVAFTKPF